MIHCQHIRQCSLYLFILLLKYWQHYRQHITVAEHVLDVVHTQRQRFTQMDEFLRRSPVVGSGKDFVVSWIPVCLVGYHNSFDLIELTELHKHNLVSKSSPCQGNNIEKRHQEEKRTTCSRKVWIRRDRSIKTPHGI